MTNMFVLESNKHHNFHWFLIYCFFFFLSGGVQSIELWNMAENKSMTIPAHENVISALAQSPVTGMVASASRDNSVKLWK